MLSKESDNSDSKEESSNEETYGNVSGYKSNNDNTLDNIVAGDKMINDQIENIQKQYGKLIQNKNWDTDGHVGKILYTNYSPKYKFKTRELWQFTAVRQFKRAVAKFYPKNWKKFVTMKTKIRVTDMYKNKKK